MEIAEEFAMLVLQTADWMAFFRMISFSIASPKVVVVVCVVVAVILVCPVHISRSVQPTAFFGLVRIMRRTF